MPKVLRWTGQINVLIRNWWLVTTRGGSALFFGAVMLAWKGVMVDAVARIFAAFALLDGLLAFLSAFRTAGRRQRWWALVADGVAGIIFGIAMLLIREIDISVLRAWVAAWSTVSGGFEIATAILMRREVKGELWLVVSGISSLIFAYLVLTLPHGIVSMTRLIGGYAIAFGAMLITLSMQLRGMHVTNLRGEKSPLPLGEG
jgi:uncharacterized membrane protein HdeD (DUF308 family)